METPTAVGGLAQSPLHATSDRVPSVRAIEETLAGGVERIVAMRDNDGIWRTHYPGGPIHSALGMMALHTLEVPGLAQENRGVIENLLDAQQDNGGYPVTVGEKPSKGVTRIVRLALANALKQPNGITAQDPQLRARVEKAIERADLFVETAEDTTDNFFYTSIADLLSDVMNPESSDLFPNIPLHAAATRAVIGSGILDGLSPHLKTGAIPLTLLGEHQAQAQMSLWLRLTTPGLISTYRYWAETDRAPLVGQLIDSQDDDGGWLYLPGLTALSLMALKAEGYDRNDPTVAKGIDFIRSLRNPTPGGGLQESWAAATTWDTGILLDLVNKVDPQAAEAAKKKSLAAILDGHLGEGRWAFSLTGNDGENGTVSMGDNDTSGMMLKVLADYYPTLQGEERRRVAESLRRGTLALLEQEQDDHGYAAFQATAPWSFGKDSPSTLESVMVDASSPSVTGRVIMGMLAAMDTDVLSEAERAEVQGAIERTRGYFESSQHENGLWWGRWIAGYLPSAAFVMPPLRASGMQPSNEMLAGGRRFLLSHQNSDGGWGETIGADTDASLAGQGDSTPAQTAFGVIGLIASMEEGDVVTERAIKRGITYLMQHRDGTSWTNGRPLYTMSVGLEYYDAPEMTSAMAMIALQTYLDMERYGPEEATRRWIFPSRTTSSV